MSEALKLDNIEFDDAPRPGDRAGEATARIRDALHTAGIDVPSSLYNEALELARDGHLGQAQSRLAMLLVLDPDDADALLLSAKVNAAQGKAPDALARLDAAVSAGVIPPSGFREYLEATIRSERLRDEEARQKNAAREQSEMRQLRAEARELRSENMRLETEALDAGYREKTWKYLAIGLGVLVVAVVAIFSYAGRDTAVEAPPVAPIAEVGTAPAEVPAPEAAQPEAAKIAAVNVAKPEVAKVAAPKVEAPPVMKNGKRVHTVGAGDTLYKLAKRYYGDASEWEKIKAANKKTLKNGKDLALGMEIVIP
jgi:LysM repeat protein